MLQMGSQKKAVPKQKKKKKKWKKKDKGKNEKGKNKNVVEEAPPQSTSYKKKIQIRIIGVSIFSGIPI